LTDELEKRGLTEKNIGGLDKLWDISLGVGGPIKRDNLWFFTAHRYWGSANFVLSQFYNTVPQSWFYTADSSRQALDDFTNRTDNLRLTWQVSRRNKLNISWDNRTVDAIGASARRWRPRRPRPHLVLTSCRTRPSRRPID
jgi:hypothetical protein